MHAEILKQILSFFQNEKYEKQFAFIFSNNEFVDSIPFSFTNLKSTGVTSFEKIQELSPYHTDDFQIFIVHNHPKSFPSPSHGDFDNMKFIFYIAFLFNINIIDYLIVSDFGFFSFKKHRLLPKETNLIFFQNKNSDFKAYKNKNSFESQSIIFLKEYTNDFNFFFASKDNIFCFNTLTFNEFLTLFLSDDDYIFLYKEYSVLVDILLFLFRPFHIEKIEYLSPSPKGY